MKVSSIICEYNPFHNGHKYQIDCIREKSDNALVAIMGGNFTQRGDIAILSKFKRSVTAVKNGIDLVIELPTVYASSSAESFARAGIQISDALGCTENLCFGAEEGNEQLLYKAAEAFENPDFNAKVSENMKSGDYYPQAVEKTLSSIFSPELAQVLTKPNNILAVEYIKALKSTNIQAFITKRIGAGHDENECHGNITNASNIRKMMLIDDDDMYQYMPPCNAVERRHPADIRRLEPAILYKMRTMSKEDFAKLPDVTEGLENRIYESVRKSTSLEELLNTVKTKRYTRARLRRIIVCALLGITADMTKQDVPYIRILAFNSKGEKVLKEIKGNGKLPLITNVADGYKELSKEAKRIFDVDLLASDIFTLATSRIHPCGDDFTKGVFKL